MRTWIMPAKTFGTSIRAVGSNDEPTHFPPGIVDPDPRAYLHLPHHPLPPAIERGLSRSTPHEQGEDCQASRDCTASAPVRRYQEAHRLNVPDTRKIGRSWCKGKVCQ